MAKSKNKNTTKKNNQTKKLPKVQNKNIYSNNGTAITVTTVLVAVLFTLTIVYAIQSFIWS